MPAIVKGIGGSNFYRVENSEGYFSKSMVLM